MKSLQHEVKTDGENKSLDFLRKYGLEILGKILLIIAIIAYVVLGAYLFIYIESDHLKELQSAAVKDSYDIDNFRYELAEDLWAHNHNYTELMLILETYDKRIENAFEAYNYSGWPLNDSYVTGWSLQSALMYTFGIVTTIGYGYMTPKTETGQLVTIVYSVFGMAMMLTLLSKIGDMFAKALRWGYEDCFCFFPRRRREKNYERTEIRAKLGAEIETIEKDYDMKWVIDEEEDKINTEESSDSHMPVVLSIGIICSYVLLGAVLFKHQHENWSYIVGAYFAFVTVTTIGYGDLPSRAERGSHERELHEVLIVIAYVVVGLALISMAFNLIIDEIVNKASWLREKIGI